MKKVAVLILLLLITTGCTNKLEEEKNTYLAYKSDLQKQVNFDSEEEADFDSYFEVKKDGDEMLNYQIIIDNPKSNMYDVKALLIHDYLSENIFPSVGIFDKPVTLLKEKEDNLTLSGTIQTTDDTSKISFRLYLEYTKEDGSHNKVYYKLGRG